MDTDLCKTEIQDRVFNTPVWGSNNSDNEPKKKSKDPSKKDSRKVSENRRCQRLKDLYMIEKTFIRFPQNHFECKYAKHELNNDRDICCIIFVRKLDISIVSSVKWQQLNIPFKVCSILRGISA